MKLLFLALCLFSKTLYAGGYVVGDGGHFVICYDQNKNIDAENFDLLDLYEAKALTGRSPALEFAATTDIASLTDQLVARAAEVIGSDHLFLNVLKNTKSMQDLIRINHHDMQLATYIDVSVAAEIPPNCWIDAVAVRSMPDNRMLISLNARYVPYIKPFDRMALLAHESLHDWFGPQRSSLAVRQAIGYLTANEQFRQLNAPAFAELVRTKAPQPFKIDKTDRPADK